MNLDSISLHAVVAEAAPRVEGGLLQKLSQLTEHDFLLFLRRPGATWRLLLALKPGDARVHLVEGDMPPAREPSSFTMLARKHLEGRPLASLRQPGLERAVHLRFGDWTLVAEIPGKVNNLVLVDPENRVAGLLHADREAGRALKPGRPYEPPPRPARPEALEVAGRDLPQLLETETPAARALTRAVFGLPPHQARFLCRQAGLDPDGPLEAPEPLAGPWDAMKTRLAEARFEPVLLPGPGGGKVSPWPLGEPGERPFPTLSHALEAASGPPGIEESRADLVRLLGRARAKAETVLQRRQEDLRKAEGADALRLQGELLLAHQVRIPSGAESATLPDWEGRDTTIRLDPRLSAVENAQRLFKEYRRLQRARVALQEPLERARRDLGFVEDMLLAAEAAETAPELEEVAALWREERAPASRSRKRRVQTPTSGPRRFRHRGFQILVGRNPRQNDRITLKVASRGDLWLHAREIPGAHVLIRTAGRQPGPDTLHAAAVLAARYSRAAESTSVDVVCTEAGRVRKPAGSPPGRVTFRGGQTLTVRPDTPVEGLAEEEAP